MMWTWRAAVAALMKTPPVPAPGDGDRMRRFLCCAIAEFVPLQLVTGNDADIPGKNLGFNIYSHIANNPRPFYAFIKE